MRIACAGVLVIACLTACIEPSAARDFGFYGSFGYNFGRGGDFWASSLAFDAEYEVEGVEDHYVSLGEGLKFEGGVQEKLSENIALRVGGGYSRLAPSVRAKNTGPSEYLWQDQTLTGRIVYFQGLLLLTSNRESVRPYAGAGAGLFYAKAKTDGPTWVCYNEGCSEFGFVDMETEYRFGGTIGFTAVLGFDYPLRGGSRLFAELNMQQVGFTIEEQELIKATEDGVDVRDRIEFAGSEPGNENMIVFEKDSVERRNPWVLQGSSIGFRVGVKIGSW